MTTDGPEREPAPWSWRLSDGVVDICPPRPGDAERLVGGRDEEWARWLGPGDDVPRPTAVILVEDEVVGWADCDADRSWLQPREVNVGYNIFAPYRRQGYARRAVRLLLQHLAGSSSAERAFLAIDAENAASLGVARAVGGTEVERVVDDRGRTSIRFVIPIDRGR